MGHKDRGSQGLCPLHPSPRPPTAEGHVEQEDWGSTSRLSDPSKSPPASGNLCIAVRCLAQPLSVVSAGGQVILGLGVRCRTLVSAQLHTAAPRHRECFTGSERLLTHGCSHAAVVDCLLGWLLCLLSWESLHRPAAPIINNFLKRAAPARLP